MKLIRTFTIIVVINLIINLIPSVSFGQSKDSIKYFIPDVIVEKISEGLKSEKAQPKIGKYIVLSHQNDTTYLLVSSYNVNFNELVYLLRNSNRYVKIDSKTTLTILLSEDLKFSEKLHYISRKARPGVWEAINHTEVNPAGYSIIYKGMYSDVKLIEAKWYQY
jgi:hypothetical protein